MAQDNVPVRVAIEDYVSLSPPERWREPRRHFPGIIDLATTVFGLERTQCFGTCPSCRLTISGDGIVRFEGNRFVLTPGKHTARASAAIVKDLLNAFQRADFLSAEEAYTLPVTDYPSQILRLALGGRTYSMVGYIGSEAGLPDAIKDLERRMDEAECGLQVKTPDLDQYAKS